MLHVHIHRECSRGIIIEEFFQHDMELRVATIFGRVVVAASDGGLRIFRSGDITQYNYTTNELLHGGGKMMCDGRLQRIMSAEGELWPKIIAWCENIAMGTDYLRVDFFVDCGYRDGRAAAVASEMNTFPWPESIYFKGCFEILCKTFEKGSGAVPVK